MSFSPFFSKIAYSLHLSCVFGIRVMSPIVSQSLLYVERFPQSFRQQSEKEVYICMFAQVKGNNTVNCFVKAMLSLLVVI